MSPAEYINFTYKSTQGRVIEFEQHVKSNNNNNENELSYNEDNNEDGDGENGEDGGDGEYESFLNEVTYLFIHNFFFFYLLVFTIQKQESFEFDLDEKPDSLAVEGWSKKNVKKDYLLNPEPKSLTANHKKKKNKDTNLGFYSKSYKKGFEGIINCN